jgi:hypothetical protein
LFPFSPLAFEIASAERLVLMLGIAPALLKACAKQEVLGIIAALADSPEFRRMALDAGTAEVIAAQLPSLDPPERLRAVNALAYLFFSSTARATDRHLTLDVEIIALKSEGLALDPLLPFVIGKEKALRAASLVALGNLVGAGGGKLCSSFVWLSPAARATAALCSPGLLQHVVKRMSLRDEEAEAALWAVAQLLGSRGMPGCLHAQFILPRGRQGRDGRPRDRACWLVRWLPA